MTPLAEALAELPRARKYLVGVSGGADSMGLLGAIEEAGFRHIVACHFSHGFRPEDALAEARLVAGFAGRLGFDFLWGEGDCPGHARRHGLSPEAAARDLRFRFFEDCARTGRCRRLILAHHADDQAETVLMNLVRGAGPSGLSGMAPESRLGRLCVLRPFLAIPGAVIREYARSRPVPFADDPTNSTLLPTRNRVRKLLAPALRRTFGDGWQAGVLRAAEILRAENEWADASTPVLGKTFAVSDLAGLPLALRRRAAHRWLRDRGIPEPGFEETARVLTLLDPPHGPAKVNLPGGYHARRTRGTIYLEPPDSAR